MTVNIPLLRKAVEWAEAEAAKPEILCEWFQDSYVLPGRWLDRECNTCYCIAGYVYSLSNPLPGISTISADIIANEARAALGITWEDAWRDSPGYGLFASENTIEDIRCIAERIATDAGERL